MIRAAFLCPCVGVGGADGFMQSLIRHSSPPMGTIHWQSVCITTPVTQQQADTFFYQTGNAVPLLGRKQDFLPKARSGYMRIFNDWDAQAKAAFKDVDVIISWYQDLSYLRDYVGHAAVIELLQNEDTGVAELTAKNSELNIVDHYVAVSQSVGVHIPPGRSHSIIYNGYEPARVMPKLDPEHLRSLWGLTGKKIVLYIGRTVNEKNCSAIVQAISSLPENYVGLIVGTSYEQRNNTTDLIYSEIAKYAPGRVFHVPTHAYHIGDFFSIADCFLIPSDFEGLPLTMIEAFAAGVPVITTDFNVARELHSPLLSPFAEILPKRATKEQLATAVQQVCLAMEKPGSHVHVRLAQAKRLAETQFTMNRISALWESLLDEVVQRKRMSRYMPKLISPKSQKPSFATPPELTFKDGSLESTPPPISGKWQPVST